VDALPDKSLRVRGAFGEENLVCHPDRTSRRSSFEANRVRLEFTIYPKEGRPETTFALSRGARATSLNSVF